MTNQPMTDTSRRQAWYAPLTASVHALGAATQEYQLALHTAELAAAQLSPDLRAPHCGTAGKLRVGQPGEIVRGFAPHDDAVFELGNFYRQQADLLRAQYQAAALLYATGCAWAANTVSGGSKPQQVVFTSTPEGQCVPGPLEITCLSAWPRYGELEQARWDLASVLEHQHLVDRINAEYPITEVLAEQQREAQDVVDARLGPAAYAYGELAEQGLHHLLMAPQRETATHHALATVTFVEEAAEHARF